MCRGASGGCAWMIGPPACHGRIERKRLRRRRWSCSPAVVCGLAPVGCLQPEKPPLTYKEGFSILAPSQATHLAAGRRPRWGQWPSSNQSTWMGLHWAVSVTIERRCLRTAKRRATARRLVARFGHTCSTPRDGLSPRSPARRASNRSRKSFVSSAPLGHRLSGGFFLALCFAQSRTPREGSERLHSRLPRCPSKQPGRRAFLTAAESAMWVGASPQVPNPAAASRRRALAGEPCAVVVDQRAQLCYIAERVDTAIAAGVPMSMFTNPARSYWTYALALAGCKKCSTPSVLAITVTPESVTTNPRARSTSGSYPTSAPGGMCTPLSMIARRILA